jgi:alkanesulfonate monooxygenase SsuD/methylene tetrahydromethanopterin reductase-like flavin-dependent oxidoreductase (luciferase family)
MSKIIQLALAVGDPSIDASFVLLAEAVALAAEAEEAGVAAIRLVAEGKTGRALDPSVAAAYLAGVHSGLGFVAEIPTTHNAPYNVARRVLSLDRATGGRAGVALRAGEGDEVSDAAAPDSGATEPARRWTEYTRVLTRLWESFPRAALIGDQEAALVVEEALIRPIDHEGAFYRVAGPLDGPSSVQGRPIVVADLGVLDASAVAEAADVVVVDQENGAGADTALAEALRGAGRSRQDVALLGRIVITPDAPADGAQLLAWADEHRLDGFELVPTGGAVEVAKVVRELVSQLADTAAAPPTLRAALGLREVAAVLA